MPQRFYYMDTKSKARIALARAASLRPHVITRINCPFAFEKKKSYLTQYSLSLSLFFFFVLQVRRRFRPSGETSNVSKVRERPPAPLPIFPAEYVPDASYEDLESLDRPQEGSVISLEWPSPYNEIRARSTNKPNGLAPVMPPTQSLPPSSSAYDDYSLRIHDNEPSELPENPSSSFKSRSSHEHPTLATKNPLYVETFTSSDQKLKGNWSPYGNLPPPLPEPRKDAGEYMLPLTLPQKPISGLSTPETSDTSECIDEHGYLKCIA